MKQIVISGTGLFTPSESISNEELVASFNEYGRRFNERNAELKQKKHRKKVICRIVQGFSRGGCADG